MAPARHALPYFRLAMAVHTSLVASQNTYVDSVADRMSPEHHLL